MSGCDSNDSVLQPDAEERAQDMPSLSIDEAIARGDVAAVRKILEGDSGSVNRGDESKNASVVLGDFAQENGYS